MKEIDLLPNWYKSDRRRQISYRTQYTAVGGVFLVMVVWNFLTGYSISRATAELSRDASKVVIAEMATKEAARIESETAKLQQKAKTLREIDSRIDVASVLGEISFLIERNVALNKVEFKATRFAESTDRSSGEPAVRAAGSSFGGKNSAPLGDVGFKVVISGVAADTSDVAELICKLEDSQYFCQVVPSFSRTRKMKIGLPGEAEEIQVSEFEISCELANYQKKEADFAKTAQNINIER